MNLCLCSHGELEHPGGECIRPLCGCLRFRESSSGALRSELESRRADPEFTQRIRARVEADREILRRLEEPEDRGGERGRTS